MRVLLIQNPSAGDEEVGREELISTIAAEGHSVTWRSVKDDGWQGAITREVELVVVAGGDGTVCKVFKELAGSSVTTTVLPLGSANNIARSLGFGGHEPASLIEGWREGRRRRCDLGSLVQGDERVPFVESVGGGIFADVLVRAQDANGGPGEGSKVDFGLRLLLEVVNELPASEWGVRLDGRDLSGSLLGVEALNVREIGPNVPLSPGADPGDGLLELTLIRESDRPALAAYVDARIGDRQLRPKPPQFEVHTGRVVVLRCPADQQLHVDDDLVEPQRDGAARVDSGVEVLVPANRLGLDADVRTT